MMIGGQFWLEEGNAASQTICTSQHWQTVGGLYDFQKDSIHNSVGTGLGWWMR